MPKASCGTILAAALVLSAAGCSRIEQIQARLAAIESDHAREAVRDLLWQHGSVYRWVEHDALRAEVLVTEHAPEGDRTGREVWLLDTAGGRLRVERDGGREVVCFDGSAWRVFAEGRRVRDLEALAEAAGRARMVRELLPMPFFLAGPGISIGYLGARVGPGEARTWHRLLVTYAPAEGRQASDRMVVEFDGRTRRVTAATVRWADLPWAGRLYRVEMDDWRAASVAGARGRASALVLSHRWRFFAADPSARPSGPVRWTVRAKRIEVDPPAPGGAFTGP